MTDGRFGIFNSSIGIASYSTNPEITVREVVLIIGTANVICRYFLLSQLLRNVIRTAQQI